MTHRPDLAGNIRLEDARSRLREIAANLDDRAMFVEAQELRDIAARLGKNRGGSLKGAKPRRRYSLVDRIETHA